MSEKDEQFKAALARFTERMKDERSKCPCDDCASSSYGVMHHCSDNCQRLRDWEVQQGQGQTR